MAEWCHPIACALMGVALLLAFIWMLAGAVQMYAERLRTSRSSQQRR